MSTIATTKMSDEEVIKSFPAYQETGTPGYITDFLGVKTRTSYIGELPKEGGQVEGYPIPSSFHATAIEWAGVLRAVLECEKEMIAVELGAGWAPWLVTVARAAELRGIESVRLIAVEGCPGHCGYIASHFSDNGLNPSHHAILHGVVGTTDGEAEFPPLTDPSADYGARAVLADVQAANGVKGHRTALLVRRLASHVLRTMKAGVRSVRHCKFARHSAHVNESNGGASNQPANTRVPCFSISTLIQPFRKVDLIHVDIQGDEYKVISSAADVLKEKVKRLVIGTHSRTIELQIRDELTHRDWELESEEVCIFRRRWGMNRLWRDGCQVWRNRVFDGAGGR
jgi:FkbM family methyltransferase